MRLTRSICSPKTDILTPNPQKKQELIDKIGEQKVLDDIVLIIIDKTLFKFLVMLHKNEFVLSSEEFDSFHCLEDSDSLPAELWSEDGWIQKFSKYKHTEDQ